MRIAFVTQWFPPEQGSMVAAGIADGLAERGHYVDVLTGFPNYPTGKLHEGYPMKMYTREQRSPRVTVHRAPLYPSHDSSALKRSANYLSFALAATVIGRLKLPQPDAWLVYSSPATAALPAMMTARRKRAPVYLMIQDLWPDSATQSGYLDGPIRLVAGVVLRSFCDWTYRRATGIGVISSSMRSVIVERGVAPSKIALVPNWVDDSYLHPHTEPSSESRQALGLPGGRLFMYAGNLGELQGLKPLVLAFAQNPQVSLVLVGQGVGRSSLQELIETRSISNVRILDAQPSEVIGRFIAAADVLVVSLKDTPLLRATMPSKVQSALAAGRPIFAHAAGDVAQLVERTGTGMASQPGNIDSTAAAIRSMAALPAAELQAMGRAARLHYLQNFSPAVGVSRLESLITSG